MFTELTGGWGNGWDLGGNIEKRNKHTFSLSVYRTPEVLGTSKYTLKSLLS